ncbi:MAG TPA: hypothetical protein VI759_04415 [Dehalococcoidia bacterium]|nr:hypothetical protein [Dehalococcoidia bacterium]
MQRATGSGFGGWDALTRVEDTISKIAKLAASEEACRLLGVDGALIDQVDAAFLNDPLEWLANDIATALRDDEVDEEAEAPQVRDLSTLVAEYKLCAVMLGAVNEADLAERVRAGVAEQA